VWNFAFGTRVYDLSARTYVMGILNVTPDSFSDGGLFLTPDRAVEHALRMVEDGADFIDVGGESTRPRGSTYGEGATPLSAEEECDRVLPVIEALASATDTPISIDTYKADVARHACAAGAVLVNDISAFHIDPHMPSVVAQAHASVILMHMRGTPQTMQHDTLYVDLFAEISSYLREAVQKARHEGIEQIIVDPGIGFGKSRHDNLRLLAGLDRFADLGCPVMAGPSRKTFIGDLLQVSVADRVEGTLGAVVAATFCGAQIVRVHDVRQVRRALIVADAIAQAAD
jgi:dihydropteroate synthase